MKSVTAMAATAVQISVEEMTKFIMRGFHALHPRKNKERGELIFDLFFTPKTGIRIWTSIAADGTTSAGVGEDAIRVQLYSYAKNRPLMPKNLQAKIVKRTQGWRNGLQDRIEWYMEKYEEKEDQIESGAYIDWTT